MTSTVKFTNISIKNTTQNQGNNDESTAPKLAETIDVLPETSEVLFANAIRYDILNARPTVTGNAKTIRAILPY